MAQQQQQQQQTALSLDDILPLSGLQHVVEELRSSPATQGITDAELAGLLKPWPGVYTDPTALEQARVYILSSYGTHSAPVCLDGPFPTENTPEWLKVTICSATGVGVAGTADVWAFGEGRWGRVVERGCPTVVGVQASLVPPPLHDQM